MSDRIAEYRRIRSLGNRGGIVGEAARSAWDDAGVRCIFARLEAQDKVRIIAEPEIESYFDVYGQCETRKDREQLDRVINDWGCWRVVSQYRADVDADWEDADSVGMCIYRNPCDPDENCHVDGLMSSAIDAMEFALARKYGVVVSL
jgi:hypothetical protein